MSSLPQLMQAQLVNTDTESDLKEAPSEAEESQPLGSRVPFMSEEFEASEPSEAAALSPSSFRNRYRSSYKTPSPSLSPTLPVQKRYRGTSELILDINSEEDELGEEDTEKDEEDRSSDVDEERERGLDDEGQDLEDEGPSMEEEEEAAPEGQQQALPVVDTAATKPLGLGYKAARRHALESTEEIAPSTYEVRQSSRSVPEQEGTARISAFRQSTLVTWVDPEDGRIYTDIPTYAPPAAPRYRFRSLEREQKRATVTFSAIWRPVLALEAWAGQTDAQRAALWHAIYDIQRENHDLRRQLAEERRERLELTDRVARMERRQESGGE
ncbi:hypothetical protein Tco_1397013 [Tanacetum coccineum]